MKKLLGVFLSVMLLIPTYLMSQDTFYVSSTGDDSKLGTQTEPWKTLNVARWTDGCTVIILDEVYLTAAVDVSKSGTLTEITIKGNNSESSLAGLSDEEFGQGTLNTSHFFDVKNGVKMNIQDITLKNINRTSGNGSGGMIYVNSGSELNINNVILKNSKVDVGLNCRGGAIWSAGKLSVRNSKFENCKAFEGGAVYLRGDAVLVNAYFENTIFKNNQTVNGSAGSGAAGAALYLYGKDFNVDFDKCYFDSNYAKNANGGDFVYKH